MEGGICRMEERTPKKLYVCICKINQQHARMFAKYFADGTPLPQKLHDARLKHVQYYEDLSRSGVLWLAGSWTDHSGGMQIYAVDSLEKAKEVQNNDPLYVIGSMYDATYYEWEIHVPYRKVAPELKEMIANSLRACGITPQT
jgi:uncharacterized protein YciI